MKHYIIEIKWALIFCAMFMIWMLMEKLTGLHSRYLYHHEFVNTLMLVPSFILYVLAIRDKKKNYYGGNITCKQSFMSGLILTLFVVLLSPGNHLVTSYFITPRYFDNAINHTVRSGLFTLEQAEAHFNIKNYIITGIAETLATSVIFTAVISLFIRLRNKPIQASQINQGLQAQPEIR